MSKPCCETCNWWEKGSGFNTGFCKRHSPLGGKPTHMLSVDYQGAWPATAPDNWCGDHEIVKEEE